MDEAQTFLLRVIRDADDRLGAAVADQESSATWLRWVSIIGAVVIVVVVGGSALTVVVYTRELAAARDEVASLNAGLEARVDERTADLARANDEIQRFAYIVTHDLRAPLVNVMGFTSELETSIGSIRALIERTPPEADGEDAVLRDAYMRVAADFSEPVPWNKVSELCQTRTAKQCSQRWYNHVRSLASREPWTPEEDRRLVLLYVRRRQPQPRPGHRSLGD